MQWRRNLCCVQDFVVLCCFCLRRSISSSFLSSKRASTAPSSSSPAKSSKKMVYIIYYETVFLKVLYQLRQNPVLYYKTLKYDLYCVLTLNIYHQTDHCSTWWLTPLWCCRLKGVFRSWLGNSWKKDIKSIKFYSTVKQNPKLTTIY